jgi:hypothetical protein
MRAILAVALLLAATAALAEPSSSRLFQDGRGSCAGSSGSSTSFTDRDGRFDGSAIRNSDGTTRFYDKSGHFTGSATNTTPRR